MKNLFFTAIAMMAFSFAGNATNSVKTTTLKSTIKSTISLEDCVWKEKKKITRILANGDVMITVILHCV